MSKTKSLLKIRKSAQRRHFLRRAQERLGYDLSGDELIAVRRSILSGMATLIIRPVEHLGVYRVPMRGRDMVVVYDYHTKEMVTMLSEGMWQTQRMSKSPDVTEKTALRDSLDSSALNELQKLKRS